MCIRDSQRIICFLFFGTKFEASNFVPKNRKQIILWGVIGAFVFKIFFAIFATFLFEFYFIKILGGLLLIWIVNDLRKDLLDIKKVKPTTKKGKEPSYISSIGKVLFADIMISFDNVIGVVAAAKGYFGFMIFGLMLSVVLTGALATYMANYIQRHIWIAYICLLYTSPSPRDATLSRMPSSA